MLGSRTTIATLEGHTEGVASVAFSPEGTLLASGSTDGMKLWDVGRRATIATLEGWKEGSVTSVSFSSNGGLLVWELVTFDESSIFGETDTTVELWDVATQETIATLKGAHASFSPGWQSACFRV